jgi:hypothetical protein
MLSTILLTILLACGGLPLALIVAAIVLVEIDKRKIRKAARHFSCTQCQTLLGDAAVALADELWMKHMRTMQKQAGPVRFRVIRDLYAVCTRCGARFNFDEKRETFLEISSVLSFEEEGTQ